MCRHLLYQTRDISVMVCLKEVAPSPAPCRSVRMPWVWENAVESKQKTNQSSGKDIKSNSTAFDIDTQLMWSVAVKVRHAFQSNRSGIVRHLCLFKVFVHTRNKYNDKKTTILVWVIYKYSYYTCVTQSLITSCEACENNLYVQMIKIKIYNKVP